MNDKILVVVNTYNFGRSVTRLLTQQGYPSKLRISGVQSKEPVNGVLKTFAANQMPLNIKLSEYVVALLDGTLYGEIRGWELVAPLTAQGIVCVGISSNYAERLRFKENGATVFDDLLYTYDFLRNGLREVYVAACNRKRA
jgi:hypothetical protein